MTDFLKDIPPDYQGFNTLLMGPSGTGKTYQLASLVEAGFDVFALFTEHGLESLLGYWADKGLPVPKNLYWHVVAPPTSSFSQLISGATKVNTMQYDTLIKMTDPDRMKSNGFIKLLEALNGFTDVRTGEKFEPADTWNNRRVLAIDSLTGINNAAMSLVIGNRPARTQTDWGMAQDQIEKLLFMLTQNCKCHVVITAHVEREVDMVLGGVKLTVSTLGRALAPKIPGMFSDVVLTVREGTTWSWNTASAMADLKTRNLPIQEKIAPGFGPIIEKWKSRALASAAEEKEQPKA